MDTGAAPFRIRPVTAGDRGWVEQLMRERWGGTTVVTRGCVHEALELPGFIADWGGENAGLITYRFDEDGRECEVVSLDSTRQGEGIGTALLAGVETVAWQAGARRVWLITTNDNLHAVRFYQRRGYRLAALHAGAIEESRRLKPSIPATGIDGIPLRDEIELEKLLDSGTPTSH